MKRHDLLRGIHEVTRPRSYLEIGVNDGRSLALSHTRSIGVDPAFKITAELSCDLTMVRATSDDFFAGAAPMTRFPDGVVDLGFVDGLHIFEYALRDFMNTERHARWTSVIVFDDVLPRSVDEAARDRHTMEWTGDVFKVLQVLERYRPDLVVVALDTEPTGVAVVLGADPDNTTLHEKYDEIVARYLSPDPQQVPSTVLSRTLSADPEAVLAADVWGELVAAREGGAARDSGVYEPLRKLVGTGPVRPVVVPVPVPYPPPKTKPKAATPAAAPRRRKPLWKRILARR